MIRIATKDDIDAILEVTQQCARHLIAKGVFQWNEHYPDRQTFASDVLHKELYVIEIEKEIVGCIIISSMMDEVYKTIKWLTQNKDIVYIHRLAIHPKYQGKGYARQLMAYAERTAKETHHNSIRLDTFSQNARNQMFYEQRGYKRLQSVYFPKQSDFPFYCYELIL